MIKRPIKPKKSAQSHSRQVILTLARRNVASCSLSQENLFKDTRSRLWHYSAAVVSVVLVLLLTQRLLPLIAPTVSPLFFAAVMFSAWYGGLGPGLLATVMSAIACNYFLFPPLYSLGQFRGAEFVEIVVFSLVALLISSLNASVRAAKQRAEDNLAKLQASEEQTRHLMDTAYEGIWLLDAQIRTEYANEQLAQMLGYSIGEMLGRSLYDFMDSEAQMKAEQFTERRKQGIRERFDFCYRRQDGSLLWAIVSTQPRFNRQGEFIGVLAMLTDITDRKQIEKEREQLLMREQEARQLAESANQMKEQFLAMVSHELRSPLNAILGWTQLMQSSGFDPARTEKALAVIEHNAKAQNHLIEDLLDLSRIVQGQVRLSAYPLNLAGLIEAAIDTVRPMAENKKIQLQCQLDTDLGMVKGDSDRLQQVIWNLLSNAIKFTPEGGQVQVILERVESHANLQVSDTGIGIHPEFLPFVFERFRQEQKTTARYGGLGLGLAITRHLVDLHGGTIAVASPGEGQGATFTITLPLVEPILKDS